MNIGMIGLDTSHCEIFTRLLNDQHDPHHISGARVTKAIPFYSSDLEISRNRVAIFSQIVKEKYQVELMEDLSAFCADIDAILLTAVDGRKHLEWVKKIAPYGKPVFIDKPIALSSNDVLEMMRLCAEYDMPIMSSSSLRYAQSFREAMDKADGQLESLYVYGPLPLQPHIPGYFWYGIHMLELVIAALGTSFKEVHNEHFPNHEVCTIRFDDGKSAIVRGDYECHNLFGAVLHTAADTIGVEIWKDEKPYYASLLEEIIRFFQTSHSPINIEETLQLIRLIEEVNTKRSEKSF
ncbi:Gfo/Idh/MocA family protein [Jeotgalibacillus soli]|uniref:Gfo/Idh/MocA-like oxidoreductase N-terminal domain-containing protein n=1 Tax=Jeotgalibacillus soli TaxID=889306 RepID=A0A0C2W112_9BACL|nr:Gfo/Idh/MocA family oxidoreductase [Jeotgalibacillus soli]KIL49843.1 hypothetical protein KP78_13110 [Jeotgalibacillus soli]